MMALLQVILNFDGANGEGVSCKREIVPPTILSRFEIQDKKRRCLGEACPNEVNLEDT